LTTSAVVNEKNRTTSEPLNGFTGFAVDTTVCFNVSNSDENSRNRVIFDIFAGNAAGTSTVTEDVIMNCRETTLLGGFNTSVTDFNFLELTNSLNSNNGTITGTVVARNAISDTEILNVGFTINPGDRSDIDIHSAAGPGAFGPVFVCHDGPPNSVVAVMSQYNITSQAPLEFEPVAQTVFQTIGGN
jgi:hypothetical protein